MQILVERAGKWDDLSFKYNRLWENRNSYNENDLQVKYNQIKNEEFRYIKKEEVVFHLSLSMKEKKNAKEKY